ncbi:hypothetical protein Kfla_6107 [Kribbella flavida DSM 17836]|uniref:DUF3137 domain-containing protein n=1 Tax=Kribbella flavida (strain DSM 17836 / JCM 10339 / NBRC 14399) TaxID=479435 RepID=D2PU59_KRIFD|nr:hypothetical protein [Kribbella flavida]ADB35110.1 hypothetical protein Kfla_6107 [Kribbella flavida DSM 17836]
MSATPAGGHVPGPRLRPDWAWQLRQGSALVYVLWFLVAVPLVVVGLLVEPRWVGWLVLAWFLVLVALTAGFRIAEGRQRRAWSDAVRQLGWQFSAGDPDLVDRWPFPPFDVDPAAEVYDVTTGRHRGRELLTGRFRHKVRHRQLGFDFLDLEVDRPLPPLQLLPTSLAPVAAASLVPLKLTVTGLSEKYCLFNGREDLALEVLNRRAVDVLAKVPPFGFSCEGRRFVAILPAYRDSGTALAHLDAACDLLDLMPERVWQAGEQWAATHHS